MKPNARTITHSQAREVNSDHPARRSATIEVLRPAARGSRIREKQAMATTNVSASTASAHPGPGHTTSAPPTTGPPIMAELRTNDISAVACCRCWCGTSWGTSPCIAGMVKAIAAPLMPSSTSRRGMEAAPVRNRVATAAWVTAVSAYVDWMITARGSLSASTPPMTRKAIWQTLKTAMTSPRSFAEPICSTANASATAVIDDPTVDTALPMKNHRNRRSSRTTMSSRSVIVPHPPAAPPRAPREPTPCRARHGSAASSREERKAAGD
jgi:hypothetical protein